jgi:hypothetical protein
MGLNFKTVDASCLVGSIHSCLPKTLSGMTRRWAYGKEAGMVAFLSELLLAIRSRFTKRVLSPNLNPDILVMQSPVATRNSI